MENSPNGLLSIQSQQLEPNSPTYQFTALLNELPINEGYVFRWEFGDGGLSEDPSPVYTFSGEGPHSVHLQVASSDDGGKEGTDKAGSSGSQEKPGEGESEIGILESFTEVN